MEWFIKVIKQYADFKGRARRQEFWMFTLFTVIISFVISMLAGFAIASSGVAEGGGIGILGTIFTIIYVLFCLFIFIPTLAVAFRRLHDTGKSGWMILVILIPIIGSIWYIVMMATEGVHGENEYGLDPKGGSDEFS